MTPLQTASMLACSRAARRAGAGLQATRLVAGAGGVFQDVQPQQSLLAPVAAHIVCRLQSGTEIRTFRQTEHLAAVIGIQIDTWHPRRLALRHAGQRAGDRWRNAAGATARPAGRSLRTIRHRNGWFWVVSDVAVPTSHNCSTDCGHDVWRNTRLHPPRPALSRHRNWPQCG